MRNIDRIRSKCEQNNVGKSDLEVLELSRVNVEQHRT